MPGGKLTQDLRGLKQLGSTLAQMRPRRVQVGIFGGKAARKDSSGTTNAEIGRAHELGDPQRGLPQRSFLRMPILQLKQQIMKEAAVGAEQLLALGRSSDFLKRIGTACENAVQAAFDSGGFGSWAQTKYATIMGKLRKLNRPLEQRRQLAAEVLHEGARHTAILVDTAQLRHAVTSRVA